MAEMKDICKMAGCLEQFLRTDKVARMVEVAAKRGGEKWVTRSWLAMHLRGMGLQCTRHDITLLICDLDVTQRESGDLRVSLSSLHAMALDGGIAQYIKDLEYQTQLVAPSLPLTVDLGPPMELEGLQGELLPLESPEGVKTPKNMVLAT